MLFDVIGGHDPMDSTCLERPAPAPSSALDDGVEGLCVGLVAELVDGVDEAVGARVRQAAEVLAAAGARVDEGSIPELGHGLPAYYLLAPAEASSNLSRYDGVRYGLRVEADDAEAMNAATRAAGFGPEVKRRIMLGTYALVSGLLRRLLRPGAEGTDAHHRRTGRRLPALRRPPRARPRPPPPSHSGPRSTTRGPCTCPTCAPFRPTWPGIRPSASPSAPTAAGLPVGVQVLAPSLGEAVMFQVAAVLEHGAPVIAPPRIRAA